MYNVQKANWFTIPAIIKKRWLIQLQYPLSFVFWFIAPILWLIPVLVFGNAINGDRFSEQLGNKAVTNDIWVFTGLGLLFQTFLFSNMWNTAYGIREEEFLGTLESVYVTPAYKTSIILANALYSLSYSTISIIAQMIFVVFLLKGVPIIYILVSIIYVVLGVLLIQGLSIMLAALVLKFKQGWRIVFTIQVLISLITPAQFPLEQLPTSIYNIAKYSPFTILVDGFRNTIVIGPQNLILDIIVVLLWALGLYLLGTRIYYWQERKLRFGGKLGKY